MTLRTSKSNTFDYDADAATYILAVEAADGQRLEYGVRQAINTFVLGCKEDGIWDAIKASCIMAGARTLAGALVPLKGAAPTNIGPFVEADYSRRTGLVGNGSTKTLNTNRSANADPQNNHHFCVNIQSAGSTNTLRIYISSNYVSPYLSEIVALDDNRLLIRSANENGNTNLYASPAGSTTGLIGAARSASNSFTARFGGVSYNISTPPDNLSYPPPSSNFFVYSRNNAVGFANARINFYSIGESLNLEALDNRIRVLMYTLSNNVTYDTEAEAYITAVETADGQPLEVGVKAAIDEFVVGCKKDGIWDAIKASCIMAGARTLSGALVPLKGSAPTNFNFVAADYNRKTGLVGDGSTKYLNSNRANNSDPQNSKHLTVYVSSSSSLGTPYIGSIDNTTGTSILIRRSTGPTAFKLNADSINPLSSNFTGFVGISRPSSNLIETRAGGASGSFSVTSQSPSVDNLCVHRLGVSGSFGDGRLAFYSIGESLDLALLDARITTLINNFAAILP